MTIKLWIIVVNYNNEHFLEECLNSIANQTFANFECLVVDDGSTDSSRSIISAMCEKDKRFVPLFQPNQGVSVVRNNGLEAALNAGAEFIAFADSDDAYFPDAFQEMINLIEQDPKIDCVIMDYFEAAQFDPMNIEDNDYAVSVFNNVHEHYQMHSRTFLPWCTIWGKLFRRRLIEDIRFIPNLHPDEDMLFMIETFRHAQLFLTSSATAYFYRANPEGVMNNASRKKFQYRNFLTVASWANEYFQDNCYYDKVATAMSWYAVDRIWSAHTSDAVEVLKYFIKSKIYKQTNLAKRKARKLWKYLILNILSCGCISKFRNKLNIIELLADEKESDRSVTIKRKKFLGITVYKSIVQNNIKRRYILGLRVWKKRINTSSQQNQNINRTNSPRFAKLDFCFGCGACVASCPVKALRMGQDKDGFYKPEVDDKCTQCRKCEMVCPFNNPKYKNDKTPACFAFNGKPEIEFASATAGGFQLVAKDFIARGGKVAGCGWGENLQAIHMMVDNLEDLPKLYKSKYLQSFMGNIYEQTKSELEKGTLVLFSGVGCQIAGLYAALGKDYDNLYTIDILCHYTPSQKIFKEHLDSKYGKDNVAKFDFRAKSPDNKFRYSYSLVGDSTSFTKLHTDDVYCKAYHRGIFKETHCNSCKFGMVPRQGDLTLGDFHRLNEIDSRFEPLRQEGALVNNEKGAELLEIIEKSAPLCVPKELVNFADKNAIGSRGCSKHVRARVYELAERMPVDHAIEYALHDKWDICLLSFLNAKNYGSVMVNNAVYQTLIKMGKTVMMADVGGLKYNVAGINPQPELYSDHDIAKSYDTKYLNEKCNTLLVGSDQVLSLRLYTDHLQFSGLSWAAEGKKKTVFGLSLGPIIKHMKADRYAKKHSDLKSDLQKFDIIYTRGNDEAANLKKWFELDAKESIADPVFLMTKEYYLSLTKAERAIDRKFIFAYIINMNSEKQSIIDAYAMKFNLDVVWIGDGDRKSDHSVDIATWLTHLRDAEMVLTDSFHGSCLSIIFNKPFYTIGGTRGRERFAVLESFGVNRLIESAEEAIAQADEIYAIDYAFINKRVAQAREILLAALIDCVELI